VHRKSLRSFVATLQSSPPWSQRSRHSRPRRAEADAKKLISELKARRKVLKEKLSELRHASGGAWEDVKTGATRAWDEFRPALRNAISKATAAVRSARSGEQASGGRSVVTVVLLFRHPEVTPTR